MNSLYLFMLNMIENPAKANLFYRIVYIYRLYVCIYNSSLKIQHIG